MACGGRKGAFPDNRHAGLAPFPPFVAPCSWGCCFHSSLSPSPSPPRPPTCNAWRAAVRSMVPTEVCICAGDTRPRSARRNRKSRGVYERWERVYRFRETKKEGQACFPFDHVGRGRRRLCQLPSFSSSRPSLPPSPSSYLPDPLGRERSLGGDRAKNSAF